ncbi:MAG: ABC transporter substrate-binding protein [Cenarchaeum sp. SB0665_bin_23]|nr:ABC transporter substrate-binding protein [Cenarchaeum sp. SB0667_bin_13]MXY37677.1 ABC transporter substrate-binding protein [Cenarchaeum sp. SB0664_bin_35]MXY61597.1 ABC transporter substrate-binding protein [Cenarchaeum sp. SB0665_bin_23]MXZ93980.1 ABC transporter substrate-binding protein [Cenarchaeum sp. SB0666_bin_15]MYB47321.1 ABC transporter substrate-binding protein [Cenarchaeum sp. SB0662_bin_33]MYC79488.1 ABC transporter substrate-binding protein [Cenarchaeum sp. SB0661_bin_35]M
MNKLCAVLVAVIAVSAIGVASAEIPKDVRIGYIFDSDWAEGVEGRVLAQMAIAEFNEYLDTIGADWTFSVSYEDAKSQGSIAVEKIQTFNSIGVDLLLGVAYSSHVQSAIRYIDANDLLVISHGSQAASLEIDDSVFRLVPSDSNQAPAINKMLSDAGIEALITVVRGDAWGDGLVGSVVDGFNGTKVETGFRYNPEATEFSAEVSLLDADIGKLIDEYGADKVGVLYVGSDEFLPMIQSMKLYENIPNVRWFSSNIQAQKNYFVDDPTASKFAADTQFTVTRSITTADNHIKDAIDAKYMDMYNATISTYGYAAYDSVWLLGTTILQTQSVDTNTLTDAIPHVAFRMLGSSGSLELTEYGDLATANYEIWQISDGAWMRLGAEN